MTIEQPIGSAHLFFVNATDQPVDIYVNYAEEPAITDAKSLAIGPRFQVQGKDNTPFGTYTFSARPKAQPDGEVLAEASVACAAGKSFCAVLQSVTGGRQLSIYENDFSPVGASRMTVRHNAAATGIAWRLRPKDPKPEIPVDEREGALGQAEWQVADEVVQNDYVLEVLVEGELVAVHPDLELEHEKNVVVYVVGAPQPTSDPVVLARHVLEQEFQVPPGPSAPGEVTAPAEPLSTADRNAPIQFTCDPLELWETNPGRTEISAVDPDAVITNLSIGAVEPKVGGIDIPDHGVAPSGEIGGRAVASLQVHGDVPAGHYEVTIVANSDSLGQRASCVVPVTVRAITIARLQSQVEHWSASGALEASFADVLRGMLATAERHLDAGDTTRACEELKRVAASVGSEKGKAISEPAADNLEQETKALRTTLGCG